MMKWLNLCLLFACALALVGVYVIKYQTLDIANEKKALLVLIEQKQGDISLLEADWAYLNQPSYIEPMVRRHQDYLGLDIIDQKQFINISDLPMRKKTDADDAAMTALFEALDSGVDPIAALIGASSQ